MSPSEWQELERLFAELVDLGPSERAERIADLEGRTPELAGRLRDLLEHDDRASEDFLQPGPVAAWEAEQEDLLGDGGARLGPYRVRELISEGGMGRVYLAEQNEPLSRLVAVKVLASPSLAEDVLERFRLEQGALAALNHPNIAAVFDSGLTPAGAPWFAMEHVDGEPITRFAARRGLGLEERIEVFLQLCDALQHAHESGLVHRDVKPGNVLVTERDGRPVVKLIDFGIAKATGSALAASRTLTQEGLLVGTPEYMAPEQCGAQARAVGVRSDIYSLGLVLYELLTESRPHDWAALRDRGLDAILKAIQQEEPPLPSASVRLDEPERTRRSRALRGDLDWIIGRAIEKEPARRYASVAALAEDLRRRARDEPVLAGPPSTWYRLHKLLRRRALPLAAGAAVLTALAAGTGLAAWKAVEASRDAALREQAETLTAWNRYAGSLTGAEEALASGDVAGARRSLERAPEQLRGWEWRQLEASLDDAVRLLEPHAWEIRDLEVGTRLALSASLDGELRLWRPSEGFAFDSRSLGAIGSSTVALLEEDAALAVLTSDGRLAVTVLETGEERLVLAEGLRSYSDLVHVRESGQLALGTEGGLVRRWSLVSGAELEPLSPPSPGVAIRVLVAPAGGGQLVAGNVAGELHCWSLEDGALLASRRISSSPVSSLAAAPAGGRVVAGTEDGTMSFLSAPGLEPDGALTTSGGALSDLTWSADGRAVVSGSADGAVRRWSAEHGSLLGVHRGHGRGSVLVVELADGTLLSSGGREGALRLFDPSRPSARRRNPLIATADPAKELSADGERFFGVSPEGRLVRLDARDGRPLAAAAPSDARIGALALSPDGTRVFTAASNGLLSWRRASSLEPLGSVELGDETVVRLEARPSGAGLIVGTAQGRLLELSLPDGELAPFGELDRCLLQDLAISPAGDRVAAGCAQGSAWLFVDEAGRRLERRVHDGEGVLGLCFLAGGEELAIALAGGKVRIVETLTGAPRAELLGHLAAVTGIAELPGRERLATSSWDGTVRIWKRGFDVPLTTLRPGVGRLDGLAWVGGADERLVAIGAEGLATYAAPTPLRVAP